VPLLITDGLQGYAIGLFAVGVIALLVRGWYLARLFEGFRILWHAGRAIAPTLPAVAAVELVRLVESGHRTLAMAAGEAALYVVVTIVSTWLFERDLLREALGYLRRARAAAPAPAA
jgi:hypothetical protein